MPFLKRSTASKDKAEPINNSMPVGLPVSASTFSHKGPDGHWTKYDAAQSAMIAEAIGKHPAGGSLTIPNSPFAVKWTSGPTRGDSGEPCE